MGVVTEGHEAHRGLPKSVVIGGLAILGVALTAFTLHTLGVDVTTLFHHAASDNFPLPNFPQQPVPPSHVNA